MIGEYCEREGYKGSGFVPTYEDKDGDWMLVGDEKKASQREEKKLL
jgi:auxin-responsive protein IAA